MSNESSSLTDALRAALREPDRVHPRHVHGRIQAAVLVPLYIQEGALHAVFTRRHDELRRHPGEISFPGGRRDEHEDDLAITALREAEEEIGLPRDAVELLGPLNPTPTVATSYAIYPFAGLIEPGRTWTPSAREVDQVLELRLADLRAGFERRFLMRRGIPFRTHVYAVDDERYIWGATARIVADLLVRVAPLLDAT
ncbi:MAG: CoA pyrophosphatase [Actinomycetota bacterium]|nr:CoA pyrophosphatase [Actinomycetota bacterium]